MEEGPLLFEGGDLFPARQPAVDGLAFLEGDVVECERRLEAKDAVDVVVAAGEVCVDVAVAQAPMLGQQLQANLLADLAQRALQRGLAREHAAPWDLPQPGSPALVQRPARDEEAPLHVLDDGQRIEHVLPLFEEGVLAGDGEPREDHVLRVDVYVLLGCHRALPPDSRNRPTAAHPALAAGAQRP